MQMNYALPDHGPPNPINSFQPARKKIQPNPTRRSDYGPKYLNRNTKNPIQPKNYIQNYGPTQPDRPCHGSDMGQYFLTQNPNPTRPKPNPTREMIRKRDPNLVRLVSLVEQLICNQHSSRYSDDVQPLVLFYSP